MRTLVVSDLHLGARHGYDVLVRPEPLERLLGALRDVERLILLGDTVELLERRAQHTLEIAAPVLRAVGERLGRDKEVIVVPGNHDRALLEPPLWARHAELRVDSQFAADATPVLARVTSLLSPARVRVSYPGVWLSERVWATHGHYLDRHLLPESAVGIARGLLGRLPRDGAHPIEYELAGGPSLTRLEALLTRWSPRPVAAVIEQVMELARAATMPMVPAHLIPHEIAPLLAMLLGLQMRHASIPALARVVHRLGVDADWVLFGHVHRLGPLAGDDLVEWQGPGGRPRIANTGSWVYEPRLVHRASTPHPYWPGGAVLLQDGGDPVVRALLDDLDVPALG